ncbi:MAG TPA: AbrB/MazE/SpoVT family DNA-binding domain-containing protein [Gallionella sp.]|nr:AbrB/MazE/SpoVT family DNA-binding domain-containing protein [Gallionella sp.]
MKATLRQMGNSQGVLIPKAIIAQLGIEEEMEMLVENDTIVLRKPERPVRKGWAEASQKVAAAKDDKLVWPEFANVDDAELVW